MNKEEILKEIEKTKEHLANMEKMLEECRCERWKPKDNEQYWYITDYGTASCEFAKSLCSSISEINKKIIIIILENKIVFYIIINYIWN